MAVSHLLNCLKLAVRRLPRPRVVFYRSPIGFSGLFRFILPVLSSPGSPPSSYLDCIIIMFFVGAVSSKRIFVRGMYRT